MVWHCRPIDTDAWNSLLKFLTLPRNLILNHAVPIKRVIVDQICTVIQLTTAVYMFFSLLCVFCVFFFFGVCISHVLNVGFNRLHCNEFGNVMVKLSFKAALFIYFLFFLLSLLRCGIAMRQPSHAWHKLCAYGKNNAYISLPRHK